LEDPRKKIEFLFEKGHIDEKTYNKRAEVLAENTWLRYELIVPPDRK